jgi:beta-glucosidase
LGKPGKVILSNFLTAILIAGLAAVLAAAPGAAAAEVESRDVPVTDGCRDLNMNGAVDPYEDWRLPVEKRVEDLLSRMTLDEKIAQMAFPVNEKSGDGVIPLATKAEIDNGAGFIFFIPGTFSDTRACVDASNLIQRWAENTRLGIPMIIGMDPHPSIYGGTRIVGGVASMALSATNNQETVKKVYQVWAKEMRAAGIHMTLGPQTDLTTDPRGVRNLDTPGENAEWAYKMNGAIVVGLQGKEFGKSSVIACPKHFPGVGSTKGGHDVHQTFMGEDKFPEGCNTHTPLTSTEETIKWHLKPFAGAIDAGTLAVMAPYYVYPEFITDLPNRIEIMLEGWLRGDLGFKGLICTDWGNVTPHADVQGGCDIARVSREYETWLADGKTNQERIDNSIRQILSGKFKLGLFENPYVDPVRSEKIIDSEEHRAIAKEAAHQGQVVLKNEGNLIPLPKDMNVLWADEHSPEEAESLAESHDVAVVSVTGYNGIWHRRYDGCDLEMFVDEACSERLRAIHKTGTPIVAIYHVRGNPFPISWVAENAAAILFAPGGYWYGSKGGKTGGGWPEILSGEYEPTGKLPVQVPRSMEQVKAQREDLPYDLGCTEAEMDRIAAAIGRGESPPSDLGDPLFEYGVEGWGPTQRSR